MPDPSRGQEGGRGLSSWDSYRSKSKIVTVLSALWSGPGIGPLGQHPSKWDRSLPHPTLRINEALGTDVRQVLKCYRLRLATNWGNQTGNPWGCKQFSSPGFQTQPHPQSFLMLRTKSRMQHESRLESHSLLTGGSISPGNGAVGG